MPNISPIEALARKLARIQGYEDIGLLEDAVRDMSELPLALRDLPYLALRRAKLIERLGRFEEALEIYERTECCVLADLGRVRCLAQLMKSTEASQLMATISFDAGLVKEFVETRDLLR